MVIGGIIEIISAFVFNFEDWGKVLNLKQFEYFMGEMAAATRPSRLGR